MKNSLIGDFMDFFLDKIRGDDKYLKLIYNIR